MADWRLARPARAAHKAEMLRQTLELLGEKKQIDGYLDIGGNDRHAGLLRKRVAISGPILRTPADGGDPEPLPASLADASLDVVACYDGLHHGTPERVDALVQSVARVLRPGGLFLLREHDVTDERQRALVALTHTVVNAGTGQAWDANQREPRHFAPVAQWSERLCRAGLSDGGARLAHRHDASANLLMAFVKA